jgi:hypothetical protein
LPQGPELGALKTKDLKEAGRAGTLRRVTICSAGLFDFGQCAEKAVRFARDGAGQERLRESENPGVPTGAVVTLLLLGLLAA